ncbi:hypothetical protein E4U40_003440 [Claviceps sp. LM458 group G5]|nr:hypothetical protein E4U40_003440 [Claviceps sp. LM458 group G5]
MHLGHEINALKLHDSPSRQARNGAYGPSMTMVMLWIFFKRMPLHKDDVASRHQRRERFACDDVQIDMYENIQPVPVGSFGARGSFANVAKERRGPRSQPGAGFHQGFL